MLDTYFLRFTLGESLPAAGQTAEVTGMMGRYQVRIRSIRAVAIDLDAQAVVLTVRGTRRLVEPAPEPA